MCVLVIATAITFAACSTTSDPPVDKPVVEVPYGFPALPQPTDNTVTEARVALGKKLFYDKQLSRTSEVSCGSCHVQENAFADPNQFSIGVKGKLGTRNAPALVNLAYNTSYFWDGGVPTLEQQAIGPMINPLEMDMTLDGIVDRLRMDAQYVQMFRTAYDTIPSTGTLTKAIASFVRSLVSGNSRYDLYRQGNTTAMTAAELRGQQVFFGEKAECFHCHVGFNLTNNQFQNNGLYRVFADPGRMKITNKAADEGKFKVPTLRNIELTAPYMHDGSVPTLEAVVDIYAGGGKGHPNTDPTIRPFSISAEEKADLISFLKSLTDTSFVNNPKFR